MLLSLALTSSLILGTISDQEFKWAFDYLTEHIEDTTPPLVYPDGYVIQYPKGYEDYEGLMISNDKQSPYWWEKSIPYGGTILLHNEWEFANIRSRAILLHEACHVLDKKTANGCNCDPYYIQYLYMAENGYSMEQIRILYNMNMHDPSRSCKIKGTFK